MLESLRNIFADYGAAQPRAVHARAARRLPGGQPHPHTRGEHRGVGDARGAGPRTRCSGSTTCSRAGNLSRVTIFALGIMPYITASIILQLLTVVWPYLEKLSKEGELGRRKITQYTRYGTIVLAVVQALGIAIFSSADGLAGGLPLVYNAGLGLPPDDGAHAHDRHRVHHVARRADHRARHRQRDVAIIFAGIVVGLPRAVITTFDQLRTGQMGLIRLLLLLVMMVVVVARHRLRGARTAADDGAVRQARRRPAHVRRRRHAHPAEGEHGRRHPGDLRLVHSGVSRDVRRHVPDGQLERGVIDQLGWGMPLYNLLYIGGIMFFAYFYTAIIFNPDDVAENMRKYGGFIPGIRPGKRTAEYIDTILTRITLAGALYLALVCDPAGVPDHRLQGGANSVDR